jgi:hypothetical protein
VEKERRIFRENRDPALAFEVVGIHYALDERFIGAKNPALPQHGVDQRRFAVVYVRDNGDIANILAHDFCVCLRTTPLAVTAKTKIAAETTSSPDESPLFSGAVEQPIV